MYQHVSRVAIYQGIQQITKEVKYMHLSIDKPIKKTYDIVQVN